MDLRLDPSFAGTVYLEALANLRIAPNFYVGASFWHFAHWTPRFIEVGGRHGIEIVDEDGVRMLPPVFSHPTGYDLRYASSEWPYWAGFAQHGSEFTKEDRLDDEFIYDPRNFLDLSGRKWKLVRKNISACETDCGEVLVFARKAPGDETVSAFLEQWGAEQGDDLYDPDAILRTAMLSPDRLFVVGRNSQKLYAILAFDANWFYVNFRMCLVLPHVRGLSDYCRTMFYQKIAEAVPGRLVNDGGSLDSPGLREYKLRLHPVAVNTIYTNEVKS